ncbi:unnamed protein product [Ceratitis capitata]|uniref:(Mediterranean fruit fly) hypothetical protein n=1 Tax=Ceratitis capitata TaxID=7213 RepID=A0A811UWH4_CERCA|nr:unnamed protein product [Ceratitis capitata]
MGNIYHCGEYPQYLEICSKHETTSRALTDINDYSLHRMSTRRSGDYGAIFREILKQRLIFDIMEIRVMEQYTKF